jgi:hypothetical protein
MSYREENGSVILTMSREDYDRLLLALGFAARRALKTRDWRLNIFELLNRLNQGNPHFTPYETSKPTAGKGPIPSGLDRRDEA